MNCWGGSVKTGRGAGGGGRLAVASHRYETD